MRFVVLAFTLVFRLTTAAAAAAPNLIRDPDFSSSNPQFITSYQFSSSNQFGAGDYAIGEEPNQFNSAWATDISPHDRGSMMIVNGADRSDMIVWGTGPIKVVPHTIYYFSAYVTLLIAASPPVLVFRINGMRVGGFTPAGRAGKWVRFAVPWDSGTSTRANISIVDDNTTEFGNDFGLDDLSFGTSFVAPSGKPQIGL